MKTVSFAEPLAVAAADSLRHAAVSARIRAQQTGVPLVVWKNGKVTQLALDSNRPKSVRRSRSTLGKTLTPPASGKVTLKSR